MAYSKESVADVRSESFPEYEASIENAYIEGYDPVSLGAPHSSLGKKRLWIGMGLILATLFGIGLVVWGVANQLWGTGTQTNLGSLLLILGFAEIAVTVLVGAALIVSSRKEYKEYRKRTGRVN